MASRPQRLIRQAVSFALCLVPLYFTPWSNRRDAARDRVNRKTIARALPRPDLRRRLLGLVRRRRDTPLIGPLLRRLAPLLEGSARRPPAGKVVLALFNTWARDGRFWGNMQLSLLAGELERLGIETRLVVLLMRPGQEERNRRTVEEFVEDMGAKMDFDQIQEQVGKLREQLDDMLSNWRSSFRPATEKAEPVKPAAKKATTAKKPAAKKTTTAKKPAAKKASTTA